MSEKLFVIDGAVARVATVLAAAGGRDPFVGLQLLREDGLVNGYVPPRCVTINTANPADLVQLETALREARLQIWPQTAEATPVHVQEVPQTLDAIAVAQIAYSINETLCSALGEHRGKVELRSPTPEEWQGRAQAVRNLVKNPEMTPEQQHAAWMAARKEEGWKYGKRKDPVKKTHPNLRPYKNLPRDQQMKDYLFQRVVLSLLQFVRVN